MAVYLKAEPSPSISKKFATNRSTTRTKHMFFRSKSIDRDADIFISTRNARRTSIPQRDLIEERVKLNISGLVYETRLRTLQRYPKTLLGDPDTRESYYDAVRGEYFFDRDRNSFDSILRFYQTGGILIKPNNVPEDIFYKELGFYKLDQFLKKEEDHEALLKAEYEAKMPKGKLMRKVWRIMEEPASSLCAKIVSILSVTIIFLSIWSFCIETLPSSKELLLSMCIPTNNGSQSKISNENLPNTNEKLGSAIGETTESYTTLPFTTSYQTSTESLDCQVNMWKYPFFIIETFCVICFTIEVVVRFIVTPNKLIFIKSPLNIIDIAAILPYFIQIAVDMRQGSVRVSTDDSLGSLVVLRILRLVRILRVFKLSRYSMKLRVLGRTLIASVGELSILVFFIFLAMILFSTVEYFVESTSGPGNKFDSIPASFWWAVVTMTTVGYGDIVPRTVLGKIVGFLCAITGVLCIALPVPSIVNNFVKQLEEAENPSKKLRDFKKKRKKEENRRSNGRSIISILKSKTINHNNHTASNVREGGTSTTGGTV